MTYAEETAHKAIDGARRCEFAAGGKHSEACRAAARAINETIERCAREADDAPGRSVAVAARIRALAASPALQPAPALVGPVGAIISDGIMRSRAAALQPALVATTWPKGRELLELVLSNHYVMAVECDHETRTDIVRCACSRWTGTSQPSVGAAIKEWINHVAGILDAGDYLSAVGGAAAPQLSVPAEPHDPGMPPQEVLSDMAKDCHDGCFACGDRPCASCMAGGVCDRSPCSCDDLGDWHGDDDDRRPR